MRLHHTVGLPKKTSMSQVSGNPVVSENPVAYVRECLQVLGLKVGC